MRKVIELIRVSTALQAGDDRSSIPAQRAINLKTAAAHGLSIVRTIEITDVSGSQVLRSPEMQDLLRLIESPEIEGVVTREFSRLMRPENFGDYALLQAFVDTKTVLYLPDGAIDLSSKTGRLLGSIRAAIAGLEKSDIKDRTWGAKEELRKAGKSASGWITWPFGVAYDREAERWHYTDEIEKVRRAFKLFLSGVTSWSELEERTGLTRYNLATILRNPIYAGWRVYDKRRDQAPSALYGSEGGRQSDRRKILRSGDEVIRVKVIDEPIVSEDDFARAQVMLEEKKSHHWKFRVPDPRHNRFVYRGFLTCSECGSPHYTIGTTEKTNGHKHDYYVCRRRKGYGAKSSGRINLPAAERCSASYQERVRLEEKLDQIFSSRLTDAGFIRECLEEIERRNSARGDQRSLKRLQAEIVKLQDKGGRVVELYIDGRISREDHDRKIEAINRDLEIAKSSLLELAPPRIQVTAEELALIFLPLFQWGSLRSDEKRRILSTLVPEIRVADYQVQGVAVTAPLSSGVKLNLEASSPSLFGEYENRRRTDPVFTKSESSRLYLPLAN